MLQALQLFADTNPAALALLIGLAALCALGLIADIWGKLR